MVGIAGCGGNADDNHRTADLYPAYDALAFGMSASLDESIIGVAPVRRHVNDKGLALHQSETDKGTRLYTSLLVQFEGDLGLIGKIITGPEGSKSETLGPQ